MTDTLLDQSFAVPDHVVHRQFAAETVVLNLQTGGYHGLNPVAGRMLELLGETGQPRTVVERISDEFAAEPGRVEQDVTRLCADLLDRGLIERVVANPA